MEVGANISGEGIKVAVRMRPLNERELPQVFIANPASNAITHSDGISTHFDKVFDEHSTNLDVYAFAGKELVGKVMAGMYGTIFAYGQTGSGKTHTMLNKGDGVMHQAIEDIFKHIESHKFREFALRASFLELHNEEVHDLLSEQPKRSIKISEDPVIGVHCKGVEHAITDHRSLLAVLQKGIARRNVAATAMNQASSRSHSIFKLVVESRARQPQSGQTADGAVLVSALTLVDLAGSESVRLTGAVGERQREGGMINTSLLALSNVIKGLGDGKAFINYRDSKLTRLLQSSLAGNAQMSIICCITPAVGQQDESKNTLAFAGRAKMVTTHAQINEIVPESVQILRLKKELKQLMDKHAHLSESAEVSVGTECRVEQELMSMASQTSSWLADFTEKSIKRKERLTWHGAERGQVARREVAAMSLNLPELGPDLLRDLTNRVLEQDAIIAKLTANFCALQKEKEDERVALRCVQEQQAKEIAVLQAQLQAAYDANTASAEELAQLRKEKADRRQQLSDAHAMIADLKLKLQLKPAEGAVQAPTAVIIVEEDTQAAADMSIICEDIVISDCAHDCDTAREGGAVAMVVAVECTRDDVLAVTTTATTPADESATVTVQFVNGDQYAGHWTDSMMQGRGQLNMADGEAYEGDWLEDSKHGHGTYTWPSGDHYDGGFKHDVRCGRGTMTFANGDRLKGMWKDDAISGTVSLAYANGDKYHGKLKDDERSGKGTQAYANGDRYDGSWKDDQPNGKGTMVYADQSTYTGHWKDGLQNGKGKMLYANGNRYEGNWVQNQRSGFGLAVYYADGSDYEGDWANDQRKGFGVLTCADESSYSGMWEGDLFHGEGTRTWKASKHGLWSSGPVYTGNWSRGKQHGCGTLTLACGDVYEGQFQEDERCGTGTYTWTNGDHYAGEWKWDKKEGAGILTYCSGQTFHGTWLDGKKHGPGMQISAEGKVVLEYAHGEEIGKANRRKSRVGKPLDGNALRKSVCGSKKKGSQEAGDENMAPQGQGHWAVPAHWRSKG